jgi:hypothetical protein
MRPEDELLDVVRGRNPMEPPGPEGPMDMPPDMPPEMPPDMPMDMEPGGDMNVPKSAVVMQLEGDMVVLQAESGEMIRLPMDAFPIPPQEGMQMVQAVVEDIRDGMIFAAVGPTQEPVELPIDSVQVPLEIGFYFWMPEMPSRPEDMAMME